MKNQRISIVLLLVLTSGPAFSFVLSNETRNRAEAAYESNKQELTFLGGVAEQILERQNIDLPDNLEGQFLKNHPASALFLQKVGCRAIAISYAICGFDPTLPIQAERAWGEEADAVRHFVFSASLTCARGKKFAEHYLISHEGAPTKDDAKAIWNEDSEMDIHNNYQGIDWAQSSRSRCSPLGFEKRAVEVALERLASGELVVIKNGDTDCRNPNKNLQKIKSMTVQTFRRVVSPMTSQVQKSIENCD